MKILGGVRLLWQDSSFFASVYGRCGACYFFEMMNKVVCILVSHLIADFVNFQHSIPQQNLCVPYAYIVQILYGRQIIIMLKLLANSVFIYLKAAFELLQCKVHKIIIIKFLPNQSQIGRDRSGIVFSGILYHIGKDIRQ